MERVTLSDKQKGLLRQVYGETVSRVRNLHDLDAIAQEWLALVNELRIYQREANKRFLLHAPCPEKYAQFECWHDEASHLSTVDSDTAQL